MTSTPTSPTPSAATAEDEVVGLLHDLIRIESVNFGDGSGSGERAVAEHVAGLLAEVGLQPEIYESAPGRASVMARIEGSDPGREGQGLVIHGHLDVVPAFADDWQVHPFSGEVRDGVVWGRGAVDMKDMDAMTLAVIRQRLREGRRPGRDVVLAFFADEEAGGQQGAHWMVDHHPDLFSGCTEAIGEVGGFSLTLPGDRRLYLVEAAQKGIAWLKITAGGRAGHGSMINEDNAVTALCEAVARVGAHRFPVQITPTVRRFLEGITDATGLQLDPDDPDAVVAQLGSLAPMIGAVLRHTVNPTMLDAGYKQNVIPGEAHAYLDGRFLPGLRDEFFAEIDELLGPDVRRETVVEDIALEEPFEGALVDAMCASLQGEDPGAVVIPYTLSGGTDAKSLAELGMRCFGFSPLLLPPDLNFAGMFHGVDERVPEDSLRFGVRVLDRFLDLA